MNKNKINYTIDVLIAVLFFIVAATGLAIFFFLPEGARRGGSQEFFGLSKRILTDWHDWSGIALTVMIAIHFLLHWDWLIGTTKNLLKLKREEQK